MRPSLSTSRSSPRPARPARLLLTGCLLLVGCDAGLAPDSSVAADTTATDTPAAGTPIADDGTRPPEDADSEHRALATGLVGELAELGLTVDLDQLAIEVREVEDCVDDIDRQQDLFFPASYFDGLAGFMRALGLDAAMTGERLRELSVAALGQQMSAYYQADRDALVFPTSVLNQLMEGLGQVEAMVAHELVHAFQDQQRGGLDAILSARGRTREQVAIAHCLIEGEAETGALAVLMARNDEPLSELDLDGLASAEGLESMLVGNALTYSTGRRWVIPVAARDGWEGVDRLFTERPTSSEQLLHPDKLGVDLPVEVPAPPWAELWPDAELVHDDVIGELALQQLLRNAAGPGPGARAAIGWDGDRLTVLRLTDGATLVHWRSVWDRELDAEQLVAAVLEGDGATLTARGRVVDAFDGPDDAVAALRAALPEWELPADPADGASTAAAEEAVDVPEASVEGDRWVRRDLGLSLPMPDGWQEHTVNGTPVMGHGEPGGAFLDNVTAMALPNPIGLDLATHRRANEAQFAAMPQMELLSMAEVDVAGRPGLRYDVRMEIGPDRVARIAGLVALSEAQQVVVSVTVAEEHAEPLADDVAAIVDGIRWLEEGD